jgi:hypothetical protein
LGEAIHSIDLFLSRSLRTRSARNACSTRDPGGEKWNFILSYEEVYCVHFALDGPTQGNLLAMGSGDMENTSFR